MRRAAGIACVWAALTAVVHTQQPRSSCPPEGWSHAWLETLKREQFLIADASARQELALALTPAWRIRIPRSATALPSKPSPCGCAAGCSNARRLRRCTADEWSSFFREITDPKPLDSWKVAFSSELGIRKRHNVRAFLLSVYANAISSDDPGVRQLAAPATAALKAVP